MTNKKYPGNEKTFQAIVSTAEKLFAKKGFEDTSVQEIIGACALSKGAFYHYFNSKNQVLDVIGQQYYENILALALPIINNVNLTAKEKIKQIMQMSRELYAASLIIPEMCRQKIKNEKFQRHMELMSKKLYQEIIGPVLAEGLRNKEIFFVGPPSVMAGIICTLDKEIMAQVEEILFSFDDPLEEALLDLEDPWPQVHDLLEGFVYALAKLFYLEQEEVKDIILFDILLENLKRNYEQIKNRSYSS